MSASRRAKRHMNLMSVIVFVACLLLVSGNTVFAVPYLQLDADPAIYVGPPEESIVATEPHFTLYALVNSLSGDAPVAFADDPPNLGEVGDFYLSVALVPNPGEPPGPDLGSFDFEGITYDVVGDMIYGTPPIEDWLKQNDLPSHGIYETYFYEFEFQLDPLKRAALYDSQVSPGGPGPYVADGPLYYQDFDVDVSELSSTYNLHVDLYTKGLDSIDKFAPFSHDFVTPIPASVILGILGLGVVGLKLRKFA